jgi:hypothetical protein
MFPLVERNLCIVLVVVGAVVVAIVMDHVEVIVIVGVNVNGRISKIMAWDQVWDLEHIVTIHI